ncbi:dihydropteroate synthase 1 domain protein [Mycobacterium xenopi 3993]|nr:dihydropteroate synthase 1 domain protein [Mycobacterium xenopi 3993]
MQVMGVVNVTDDSFSDGGRYLDPDRAVEHGLRLAPRVRPSSTSAANPPDQERCASSRRWKPPEWFLSSNSLPRKGLRSASTRSAPGGARGAREAPGSSTTSPVGAPTQRWRRC